MTLTMKSRSAWEDRFRTPSPEDLFPDLDKLKMGAVDTLRNAIPALPDVQEVLDWTGLPWRWCFVYSRGEDPLPLAYLVPQPQRPLLVVPVPEDVVLGLTGKRVAKSLRDGLISASDVGGVRWAQWELSSKSQAEELLELVRLRARPPVTVP